MLAGIAQKRTVSFLYCIYSYYILPLVKYLDASFFPIQLVILRKDSFTVIAIHINLPQQ